MEAYKPSILGCSYVCLYKICPLINGSLQLVIQLSVKIQDSLKSSWEWYLMRRTSEFSDELSIEARRRYVPGKLQQLLLEFHRWSRGVQYWKHVESV
jgi:hypothetical protein